MSHELDIALLRPPVRERAVALEVIAHEPLIVVLPSSDPLAAEPTIDLSQLAGSPFITYPAAARSVMHEAVERVCHDHGFEPRVRLEVAETATLVAFVAAGLGISLVPASVADLAVRGATYRPLSTTTTVELALAWRRDHRTPVVDATLDAIRAHMTTRRPTPVPD